MGALCSSKIRVLPKVSHSKFGQPSGILISIESIKQENPKIVHPPIQLILQESDILQWQDPFRHLSTILRTTEYEVQKILKVTNNSITAEIIDSKKQQSFIFKRTVYDNFDIASNNISYIYNLNKIGSESVLKFVKLTISLFQQKDQQIKDKRTSLYTIDRIIPKYKNLIELIEEHGLLTIHQSLEILKQISLYLYQMHQEQIAYRFLRPESILTIDFQKYILSNPSLQNSEHENDLINQIVTNESDYYIYDKISFQILFLYLINNKKYTYDELLIKRIEKEQWEKSIQEYIDEIQIQFKNDIPQMILNLIKMITNFEIDQIPALKEMSELIRTCQEKGLQTNFKNDSFGAYLQFHKNKKLDYVSPWLYFTKRNQIHLYNLNTQKFHFLKLFYKKEYFKLPYDIIYNQNEDKFFFFADSSSSLLMKVYDETHDKEEICFRREVEKFRYFRQLQLQDHHLIQIQEGNNLFLYVLNSLPLEEDQQIYYDSFIIKISSELVENILDEEDEDFAQVEDTYIQKRIVRIQQGPRDYQWRKYTYHFYDPHNRYIYSIPNYNNIFQNGIRFSFYDTSKGKGNFKEGFLRFACSDEETFKQFCKLDFRIEQIIFCLEAQHGVFLLQTSNNILILDFNFQCFFSLASLVQLQNYEDNYKNNRYSYQFKYEIKNQPFILESFNTGGKNFSFQNGYLHCLARFEIETVHCIYEIKPNQACLILLNCYSLNSKKDLLQTMPKSMDQIVQEEIKNKRHSKKYIKFIKQYGCIKYLCQDEQEAYIIAENPLKQKFYLHVIKLKTIKQVSDSFSIFKRRNIQNLLLTPLEYFTYYEDQHYYMVYVNEDIQITMEQELVMRKSKQTYFLPNEMSLLCKILFRAVVQLEKNQIEYGNLNTSSICYTRSGQIKIQGWYAQNKINFRKNIEDAMKIIYGLCILEVSQNINQIDYQHPQIQKYEGLNQLFIKFKKEDPQDILKDYNKYLRQLMLQAIDYQTTFSRSQVLIWIGYGTNFLIIVPLDNLKEIRYIQLKLFKENKTQFKISKHCMFTYNNSDQIYISGSNRDNDSKSQSFFFIQFSKHKPHQIIILKSLPDIPYRSLSPTLLYADGQIYCIGGYELTNNQSKSITDKVFCYDIKFQIWKQLKSLPTGLYGSTAIYSNSFSKIYLFGGISDEIDLTNEHLKYFIYDIQNDYWEFRVDLSYKSPFVNSRFIKPMIDIVNSSLFISYQKSQKDQHIIILFELVKGGINLKFQYYPNNNIKEKQNKEIDQISKNEQFRCLQDNLSMIMFKDCIYIIDEENMNLLIFKLKDSYIPELDITPCMLYQANV